jgi:plasmid maintenance system antidote protein VapI
MQTQIALPVSVLPEQVIIKKSLGSAIELCAELAGYELDKTLALELNVDKGQFSRWLSGTEGIQWPKFSKLMDTCGNDAPLLWMLHQRGYDLHSIRRRETETERENRLLREENAALRRVLTGATA